MGEVYTRIVGGEMKFRNTFRTDNGEGKPLSTKWQKLNIGLDFN